MTEGVSKTNAANLDKYRGAVPGTKLRLNRYFDEQKALVRLELVLAAPADPRTTVHYHFNDRQELIGAELQRGGKITSYAYDQGAPSLLPDGVRPFDRHVIKDYGLVPDAVDSGLDGLGEVSKGAVQTAAKAVGNTLNLLAVANAAVNGAFDDVLVEAAGWGAGTGGAVVGHTLFAPVARVGSKLATGPAGSIGLGVADAAFTTLSALGAQWAGKQITRDALQDQPFGGYVYFEGGTVQFGLAKGPYTAAGWYKTQPDPSKGM